MAERLLGSLAVDIDARLTRSASSWRDAAPRLPDHDPCQYSWSGSRERRVSSRGWYVVLGHGRVQLGLPTMCSPIGARRCGWSTWSSPAAQSHGRARARTIALRPGAPRATRFGPLSRGSVRHAMASSKADYSRTEPEGVVCCMYKSRGLVNFGVNLS